LRIGSANILTGKEYREAKEQEKALQKKQGKRGQLTRDKELAALEDYEKFQRACFETMWINKLAAGSSANDLRERRSELVFDIAEMEHEGDSVHRRRLHAELTAIARVLEKEERNGRM
jgi:hypothetical protein